MHAECLHNQTNILRNPSKILFRKENMTYEFDKKVLKPMIKGFGSKHHRLQGMSYNKPFL